MKVLSAYIRFAGYLNEKAGYFAGWLTSLMVLVVCLDVFTRYFLRRSSTAVQEFEWHLFAVIFIVGAAYTLKHDRHVRVDVLYTRFSPKNRAWINLLGCLIFLIPFCLMVIWSSKDFIINSYNIGETSPDPGGLPARYVLKAVIPLGFLLLLLQGFSLFFESLLVILGKKQEVE